MVYPGRCIHDVVCEGVGPGLVTANCLTTSHNHTYPRQRLDGSGFLGSGYCKLFYPIHSPFVCSNFRPRLIGSLARSRSTLASCFSPKQSLSNFDFKRSSGLEITRTVSCESAGTDVKTKPFNLNQSHLPV